MVKRQAMIILPLKISKPVLWVVLTIVYFSSLLAYLVATTDFCNLLVNSVKNF